MTPDFWNYLQLLVDTCPVVIDRPKGSPHPRYPGAISPVDYGYLSGTTSMDSGGVDIWVGSLDEKQVVGGLCTVDLFKKGCRIKDCHGLYRG